VARYLEKFPNVNLNTHIVTIKYNPSKYEISKRKWGNNAFLTFHHFLLSANSLKKLKIYPTYVATGKNRKIYFCRLKVTLTKVILVCKKKEFSFYLS